MNLEAWLSHLEQSRRSLDPAQALEDTRCLIQRLQLEHQFKRVIMVGGTNGKGSCVALLTEIYMTEGYRVGTFIKPHLLRFNERICIQNKPVSDELICRAFERIQSVQESIFLSYFQYSFLAALLIFQEAHLDLLVLEVGIGGRYDAVNVIEPDVSIIASIGMDHMDILGNSREKIAFEKAGIMRAHKPTICGDNHPPVIINHLAREQGVLLYVRDKDFTYEIMDHTWNFVSDQKKLANLPIPSIGLVNASTVLMAVTCFQNIMRVSEESIRKGLRNVFLAGRCQLTIVHHIRVLFDVAHNVPAITLLKQNIESLHISGKVYAIFGIMNDKDFLGALNVMLPIVSLWKVVGLTDQRSVKPEQLQEILLEHHVDSDKIQCYNEPAKAFYTILKEATVDDLVVVFGSFRTVSLIMQAIST